MVTIPTHGTDFIMTLRYRIVEQPNGKYSPQYFEGIWIFGTWKSFGRSYKKIKNAEDYIIEYARMVLASRDKIVREITVK